MKARATIVLVLVLSLALVPVLASVPVHAQSQYSERLDVYTAGQNAFWSITLNRLGANLPVLTSVESMTGLTSYSLVAMSAQSAVSDFQTFGVDGYNLLNLPSTPSQGLFLTITATGSSSQPSIVSALGQQFGTDFTQVASSGDTTTYFAPVDFVNVAAPILYKLVPASLGGFASFATESKLVSLPMPFIELTGTYNGTGFSHKIALGADTSSAVGTTGAINLSELIGSTNATISSSASSNSSEVVIHSLDGVIVSSDAATVSNDAGNFSGSYSLSLASGEQVKVNATLESQPPTAVAYRELDHGTLAVNDSLGVTIVISNSAQSEALDNVTVNDNWWKSYPTVFELSSGSANNYSFTIPSIAAGHNVTEAYVLKVISSTPSQIVIPAATVSYSYQLSTSSFSTHVNMGQQVIQVNGVGPALSATVRPSILSGSPLGTIGDYVVTITNAGTSPALNVKLQNYTVSNIAQNGGSTVFDLPIVLSSLTQRNFTKTFSLEYSNTAGQSQNITLNSVQLIFSHDSMVLPFIRVTTNDTLTPASLSSKTLTASYIFTNAGKGIPSGITALESFPTGVTCKTTGTALGTCSGSTYAMTVDTVTTQKNTLQLNFTRDNFIIPPTTVTTNYDGLVLHTYGGSYVIPAGIVVTKSFNPDAAFPGTNSVVTIGISNLGSLPVFNATVGSGTDTFDKASTGSSGKTFAEVVPQNTSSFTYTVTITAGAYGNISGTAVSTSFLFGGASQDFSLGTSNMVVYAPVTAAVVSSPSTPEENHDFTLAITITNPAAVPVSDVVYTLTLPTGVSVVSGATLTNHVLTITVPSMLADSNSTVSLTLSTNSGLTIDTSGSHLTFQYLGATLAGLSPATKVVVNVDATTRYTVPIAIAVLIALVAVVYVRRKVGSPAQP
ncbi:MAG: hypothetical protein OK449_02520 [Thaumarchaeota archaeon]|nr:hypothetical protein [Nitrososphaerota archaeon]